MEDNSAMESDNFIKKALEDADLRGGLIHSILSIKSQTHELGAILCELHNAGRISLLSKTNLETIESLNQIKFWAVSHPICEAIPRLDSSYREVLTLVQTLVDKAGSDGAAGMPYTFLIKWCKLNPDKAQKIVSKAKDLDPICLSHCTFALQALEDIELAFDLLSYSNKKLVKSGFQALGRLEINGEPDGKRIIDKCCEALTPDNGKNLRLSAIETAFKTWEKIGASNPYRQQEFLENVITQNECDELVQLSAFLFYHPNGLVERSIYLILKALTTNERINPKATLHWLDLAMHANKRKWDYSKTLDAFAAQIARLDSEIESNQLYHFCDYAWEDSDNISTLFSSWLLKGQFNLCTFLVDMVGEAGKKNASVEIKKSDLPNDSDDQIFIARKCIGFLWLREVTAASLLMSIVKNGKKVARQVAEELLFNPLLLSYSGALRAFLEEKCGSSSKRISNCAQRLIEKHNTYTDGLKSAKHLVELLPTLEQRRSSAMLDRERRKNIHNKAHEKSLFAQLTSKQVLLYGKKSFSIIQGPGGEKTPNITPLSEFSYTTEVPRLSVVDPVGFTKMLTIFRLEQRVSK